MKYLVIGAGGTGGSIAAFMTEAGKDAAVIDSGKHLEDDSKKRFENGHTLCCRYRATNLKILDSLSPSATTSMQRDFKQGNNSEINGLIFEVVRLGRKYGVNVPTYEMIAQKLGFKA